ncbi:MAG: FadR family transcriptional regulator, partial [Myxococcaceae bacterium]
LPGCGQFGSERKLACRYQVSRGTVREALRRLAARGLVVQRPGRKTRAVALDASLTLENLGVALHDERSQEARWLLEGFFCLKRQVLVELLAECCERASSADRALLAAACFTLWDAARWDSGERCAQLEFDLLGLAARVADRPGHLLLIQSLRRSLRGNAARLLPLMGGEALRQWACCAMQALQEHDARALQCALPTLLKVCDERVLEQFAPALQEEAREARSCVDVHDPGRLGPAAEDPVPLGRMPCLDAQTFPVDPGSEVFRVPPAALGFNPGEPGQKSAGGRCRAPPRKTCSTVRQVGTLRPRKGASSLNLPPMAFVDEPLRTVRKEGGSLHGAQGPSPFSCGGAPASIDLACIPPCRASPLDSPTERWRPP